MTPKYFLELDETIGRVEVSDNTLGRVDYDEGIRRATNIVRSQTEAGRKVIFVDNGGSAAIASHPASTTGRTVECARSCSSADAESSRFPASGPITHCALGGN